MDNNNSDNNLNVQNEKPNKPPKKKKLIIIIASVVAFVVVIRIIISFLGSSGTSSVDYPQVDESTESTSESSTLEATETEPVSETEDSDKDWDDIPDVDHPEDIGENESNSFVDKLVADDWYIAQEGDFTYYDFHDDSTVTVTYYVYDEVNTTVTYEVNDDGTVSFEYTTGGGDVKVILTDRSEQDMVDIELEEFGETVNGTMEWKSNLE